MWTVNDTTAVTVYRSSTLGLIPLLLPSFVATLYDRIPYYYCLLQQHSMIDSRTTTTTTTTTTVYCSATLRLIPVLLLSIAAALYDLFPYYYCLLQQHSRTDSRITVFYCISGVRLAVFSLFFLFYHCSMSAKCSAVCCNDCSVTAH